MRLSFVKPALLLATALLYAASPAASSAQNSEPITYKDMSVVKLPAGSRVAIVEWEDLECPACAHAFPIVHEAAAHYHIPVVRRDFPLRMHIWSADAAVIARYIQDKYGNDAGDKYRRAVFANQTSITSKEDLQAFTQHYFQSQGSSMPFVVDPQGTLANEVHADYMLGERLGLVHTPTIFVVTPQGAQEVNNIDNLYSMLDTAIANTGGPEKPRHTTTTAHK